MADTERDIFGSAFSDAPSERLEQAVHEGEEAKRLPRDPSDPDHPKGRPDLVEGGRAIRAQQGLESLKDAAQPADEAASQPPAAGPDAATRDQPGEAQPKVTLDEHVALRVRAQAAERERDQLRQQMELERQRLQYLQSQPATQPEPEQPPNMFEEPEAYHAFQERQRQRDIASVFQTISQANFDWSMRRAQQQLGAEYEAARASLAQATQNNPGLRAEVDALNPLEVGDYLVAFHAYQKEAAQRQKVLQTVGNDPDAYRGKVLDEALKDPAFLARALEAAREHEGLQPRASTRPETIVRLPSVNRASSATRVGVDTGGESEEDIFASAGLRRK